jgi:hypothetical protein
VRDLEAAGKVARSLTRDRDGAGAVVHAQIGAAQFPADEPSRTRNPTAEIEHGDAGRDTAPFREGQNFSGAHEALLFDELAGGVGRQPGSLESLGERSAIVLLYDC